MQNNVERRCTSCQFKLKGCNVWNEVKSEKTVSGWDLNRFAISCSDYKENDRLRQ